MLLRIIDNAINEVSNAFDKIFTRNILGILLLAIVIIGTYNYLQGDTSYTNNSDETLDSD